MNEAFLEAVGKRPVIGRTMRMQHEVRRIARLPVDFGRNRYARDPSAARRGRAAARIRPLRDPDGRTRGALVLFTELESKRV